MSTLPERLARPKKSTEVSACRCQVQPPAVVAAFLYSISTLASKFRTLRIDTLPETRSTKPGVTPRRVVVVVLISMLPLASMLKMVASAIACTARRTTIPSAYTPAAPRALKARPPMPKSTPSSISKPAAPARIRTKPLPLMNAMVTEPRMSSRKPGAMSVAVVVAPERSLQPVVPVRMHIWRTWPVVFSWSRTEALNFRPRLAPKLAPSRMSMLATRPAELIEKPELTTWRVPSGPEGQGAVEDHAQLGGGSTMICARRVDGDLVTDLDGAGQQQVEAGADVGVADDQAAGASCARPLNTCEVPVCALPCAST